MENGEATGGGEEMKDRSAGLIAFGIVQIIIGAFCALMAPFMVLGAIMAATIEESASASTSPAMMIPGTLFYVVLAVWFIWMGIGSIKARRWARALLLVTSWMWLISGSVGLLLMAFLLPDLYDQMGDSGDLPAAMARVVMVFTMGFMAFFYVLLPGVYVAFYGSRHVKATCERKDACVRWTDKCPLPVLAVSLTAAFCAVWVPAMGFYNWAVPCFGTILSGGSGAALMLVLMGLLVYVARGTFRLSLAAWWCATLMIVAWGVSVGMTFMRTGLMGYYEKMQIPTEQLELMSQSKWMEGPVLVVFTVGWMVVIVAYLIYVRRYFVEAANKGEQQ